MNDQQVVALRNGVNARLVRNYTSDMTPPQLQSFNLDLTREVIVLSFTETVDTFLFNVSSIYFQDTADGNNTFNHYRLTGSSYLNSSDSSVIEVVLGLDDLNTIKQMYELATEENNTFIRINSNLIEDVFGNNIVEVSQNDALQVDMFFQDVVPPILQSFDVDLDQRIITLSFSETIDVSSLDISGFTLVGLGSPRESYQLMSSFSLSENSSIVMIDITRRDFNAIKLLTNLATGQLDTSLRVLPTAIADMAGNNLTASQLRVTNYTRDASSPVLEFFDLDMDGVTLTLGFSETVNISTINFTAITIVESEIPYFLQYQLLEGRVGMQNSPVIEVQILREDEDNLKRIDNLATSPNNTYLVITSYLIEDMDGNSVEDIVIPEPVRNFTDDTTPPSLVSYDLNLTSNLLTLVFSETVNTSSFAINGVTLQSEEVFDDNTTLSHTFTNSIVTSLVSNPTIVVNLSRFDSDEIRRLPVLASSNASTYLVLDSNSIFDMVGLGIVPISNTSALPAQTYVEDEIRPYLESFGIDLTMEVLYLNFSETMNITTFEVTQVTLHEGIFPGAQSYSLTGGQLLNTDHSSYLALNLSTPDLNAIKFQTELATDITDTFLTLTETLIQDMNSNPVLPVTTPRQAEQFTSDTVSPQLQGFDLDLDQEILTLTFSETVNADSLDVTQISLQSEANSTQPLYSLSDMSFTSSINGTVIVVNISTQDLNRIKQLDSIGVSNETTFLSVTESAIVDMSSNRLAPIPNTNAVPVTVFSPDLTNPQLLSFLLDLDREILILSFTETVNVSTFDVTGITLQSDPELTNITSSVSLSSYSNLSMTNSPEIVIQLSQFDLNMIKDLTGLATNQNDTYITVNSNVIMDTFRNPLAVIDSGDALEVSNISLDFTPPELLSFEFDLNLGTITFFFSESVNVTSFDPTEVVLFQFADPSRNPTSSNYSLTGFSPVPLTVNESSTIIVFQMSTEDVNNIKSIITLATQQGNTFLSFSPDFMQDQFSNPIRVPGVNLGASNFTSDSDCPSLESFDFDLNVGLMSLTFNETVNTSTFDPTMLTVLNNNGTMGERYRLTSGTFNTGEYTRFINLMLSDFDLDLLLANEALATEITDTFVLLSERSIQDSTSNYYCNNTIPTQVTNITMDTTAPVLLNFTLDLQGEVLILTFSETVRIPLLTVSTITFLARPDPATSGSGSASGSASDSGMTSGSGNMNVTTAPSSIQYTLTEGSSFINYSSTPHIVTFQLTQNDLNGLKSRPDLASSRLNTLLSITSDLTRDYNSNDVVSVPPTNPITASEFLTDATQPIVTSFNLDLNARILTLTFSEAVNISSFDVRELTLQGRRSSASSSSYTLTATSQANLENLVEVNIFLSDADANAIKEITTLATAPTNTFISLTSDLIRDFFGLPVVAVSNGSALSGTFMADMTPPVLLRFSLNLTSEELILTFDETVDASSVQISNIEIQSDDMGSNQFTLRDSNASRVDSTQITITLGQADLYSLKTNLDLGTDDNNTCVFLRDSAIRDLSMIGVPITSTTNCIADFYGDFISPHLTSFVVNVNASTLILNFDEPIDIGTINETFLTLQAQQRAGSRVQEVTLTGGESTTTDHLEVVLAITLEDLNLIKQNLDLLVDIGSSFLRIIPGFISDFNGNAVAEISANSALQASAFVEDTINPVLQSFDIDLNNGYLTLYFSETVDVSTIDFTGITLQWTSMGFQASSHTLTNGRLVTTNDAPVVVVEITNDDLNVLKTRDIAGTNTSAWVTLTNTTILDVSGYPVVPILSGLNAIPVSRYTPDSTPPSLLGFSLDVTAETLTLSFNESVDFQSLDVSQITLASGINITGDNLTYTLNTSRTMQASNLPQVVISLSTSDLNEIKRRDLLGTSENDTYIFFSQDTIDDTFGNSVVGIPPSGAIRVTSYQRDTINPVLTGFDFDANSGTLTLTFSETVNSSSLDTSGINLFDRASTSTPSYSLSGQYVSVSPPLNIISIVLTNDDLNQIKIRETLAVDNSSLYLSLTSITIMDMDGNSVLQSPTFSLSSFIPDTTPPRLLNFAIDMNRGELTLRFDETVNATSLIFDYLALINNETFMPIPIDPDTQHQLNGGRLLTDNLPEVTFAFTEADLNEIKRQDMCTRTLGVLDCFLVYRSGAIMDMNGNGIDGCRQVNT